MLGQRLIGYDLKRLQVAGIHPRWLLSADHRWCASVIQVYDEEALNTFGLWNDLEKLLDEMRESSPLLADCKLAAFYIPLSCAGDYNFDPLEESSPEPFYDVGYDVMSRYLYSGLKSAVDFSSTDAGLVNRDRVNEFGLISVGAEAEAREISELLDSEFPDGAPFMPILIKLADLPAIGARAKWNPRLKP